MSTDGAIPDWRAMALTLESDRDLLLKQVEAKRVEIERLHTWAGLMELLDEHWPEDVFPTRGGDGIRDAGPRIVALLRVLDQEQRRTEEVGAKNDEMQALWSSGNASDGHHTHNELYEYRLLYNAALFNAWHRDNLRRGIGSSPVVCKSWFHSDGESCFGTEGEWFIVVAELPTGQISNHYRAEHWNLFKIPDAPKAPEYDGHTPEQAAQRLRSYLEKR